MKDWFKKYCVGIIITILISIIPIWIIVEVIHYNCEKDSKIYVEWTVYDGISARHYSGTYIMKGIEFRVRNYLESAGKYGGCYRDVSIIDNDAWGCYINKQSVCIYQGFNDVEVTTIKVMETKSN